MTVEKLRQKHPVFIYHSFASRLVKNKLHLSFLFQTKPDIFFRPEIVIENVKQSQIDKLGKTFDNLVFHLGLAEIPSYWKATCSPQIIIKAGYLSPAQIKFWHKLLINGLGQFFYENRLDFTQKDFLKIKARYRMRRGVADAGGPPKTARNGVRTFLGESGRQDPEPATASQKYLIPLGGGKDSIVTLEILKKTGLKTNVFTLNPTKITLKIAKLAGAKKPIIVRREIDPKLIFLNKQGYLNGHVPITAYISFLSLLVAALTGHNNIVFSNERSADEENLIWKGRKINHQYSKSLEFENDFRQYSLNYLTLPAGRQVPQINYFSFLRPLYELQISQIFSQYPQYFSIFRSCNVGYKKGTWCCQCPKCLSVFLLLSPFLSPEKLSRIFGQNLLEKKSLLPTLKQLLGIAAHKPFECVGTIKENVTAAYLILQQNPPPLPYLLKTAQKYLTFLKYRPKKANKILNSWNNKHNLPSNLPKILKKKNVAFHTIV